jgi:hypothetical protein
MGFAKDISGRFPEVAMLRFQQTALVASILFLASWSYPGSKARLYISETGKSSERLDGSVVIDSDSSRSGVHWVAMIRGDRKDGRRFAMDIYIPLAHSTQKLTAYYQEYGSNGEVLRTAVAEHGTVSVSDGCACSDVAFAFNLRFVDGVVWTIRHGAMYSGKEPCFGVSWNTSAHTRDLRLSRRCSAPSSPPAPPSTPPPTTPPDDYYDRHEVGCSGTVDDTSHDDGGCGGYEDDNDSYSDDGGCGGYDDGSDDSYDSFEGCDTSSSDYDSSSGGCEGDDGYDSSDSCEGDAYAALSGKQSKRKRRRPFFPLGANLPTIGLMLFTGLIVSRRRARRRRLRH